MGIRLNKEQKEAVEFDSGPLMIIAGAGTGKTTVITERIKYLIEKNLAKSSEILALTFTEKAAREMEERVDVAMPYGYTQMWISTFHSFCDRILRAEALQIGLDPRFKLMTESETIQLVRNHIFKSSSKRGFSLNYFRPLGNPTKFVGGMLQHFSRLQDEDVNPNEYVSWVNSKFKTPNSKLSEEERIDLDKYKELAEAYKTYEELKAKEGVMDFGDLITKTLKLFRDRKNILKQYQKQFKYILVDEFQDTNIAQNELVKLLAKKDRNITVVLDDDQSIYRFRGAAISNALQFRKSFPNAKLVTLTTNYRSAQLILDYSHKLIQFNNPDRLESIENIDKQLKSATKSKGEVKFIHKDRVENEAEDVVKTIVNLTSKSDFAYKDIAILVRANNHSDSFIRALSRHNIPYQFLGPGRLFKQSEIVDLISYLKVLYNFEDDVSLFRLLSMEHFNLPQKDLVRISNFARKNNLSLFDAVEKVVDPSSHMTSNGPNVFIGEITKKKIKKIVGVINKHLKLLRRETAGQLLYDFLVDTGLITQLLNPDDQQAEKNAKNISKFFDKLKSYESDHEDASVYAVVDWIELAMELGESPLSSDSDWTEINAVNILTVHSAKGLEFPVVFMVNLVGQRFPTIQRREQIPIPVEMVKEVLPQGDYHLQEERRLFYVGMTRAKDKVYFTAADYYGEGKREKKLSPFIFEALGDEVVGSESFDENQNKQLSFLDYKPEVKLSKTLAKDGKSLDRRQSTTGIHVDFLSYSQIQTFQVCPLHFKLRYILRIPTPPNAALSFGSTIHAVMRDFYSSVRAGEKPTMWLINRLLDSNWISEGYSSKSHETKMFKRGKKYLREYLKNEFDKKVIPVSLEEGFVVPLRSTERSGVVPLRSTERSGVVPLRSSESHNSSQGEFQRRLKIGGKIDRVDIVGSTSPKDSAVRKLEIIDYKTGERIPTQKEVDKDLQLTMYAIAANSLKEYPFDVSPDRIKLSLYYFDQQIKLTTTRTKEQLEQATQEIFEWRNKIEESEFLCSRGFICQNNCEYKLMCHAD
jgi:DNA helicase-2/ATP-dependent DNA helicase PcrA